MKVKLKIKIKTKYYYYETEYATNQKEQIYLYKKPARKIKYTSVLIPEYSY